MVSASDVERELQRLRALAQEACARLGEMREWASQARTILNDLRRDLSGTARAQSTPQNDATQGDGSAAP
jgi:hypothetical protein